MLKQVLGAVVVFGAGVLVGRSVGGGTAPSTPAAPVTAVASAPRAASPTAAGAPDAVPLGGRVAEVIQVPQYTYLRLESGEWAAVTSEPSLKAGDTVTLALEQQMKEFTSSSLGRTFPSIWFGALAGPSRGAPKAPAAPAAPAVPAGPAPKGTVSVADLHARRAELSGKRVTVHGTVDRVNVVQGVNYVHLKDGTGAASSEDDDLLCLTESAPAKGAVVTLEGTVALDKDVGMGARPVALESAHAL